MATILENLIRSVAAVTIDIEAAEAGKAALETRIIMLMHERQRLEAELYREQAAVAAGKTSREVAQVLQQASCNPGSLPSSSLAEPASSSASMANPGPHHGVAPLAQPQTWGAGQAASFAANAGAASRKRKRQDQAEAMAAANPTPPGTAGNHRGTVAGVTAVAASASFVALQIGDTSADADGVTWIVRSVDGPDKVTWEELDEADVQADHATAAGVGVGSAATANPASASVGGSVEHSCSFCKKRFPTPEKLAIHERTHTGKKPYACSMCPMRFTNKSQVAPHERTHTGEKPYACSMCPRRFCNQSNIHRHERTHTGEQPYACSI